MQKEAGRKEGRKEAKIWEEEFRRGRDKKGKGRFIEGTGPGLHHLAIEDEENSYHSQRE